MAKALNQSQREQMHKTDFCIQEGQRYLGTGDLIHVKGTCQIQQTSHLDFGKTRRETKKFLSEMVTRKRG